MEERYYQDKLQSSLFDDGANNILPMDSIQVSAIQPAANDVIDVEMSSEIQIVEQLRNDRPNRRRHRL